MEAVGIGLACQAAHGLMLRGIAGSCPSCWQTKRLPANVQGYITVCKTSSSYEQRN